MIILGCYLDGKNYALNICIDSQNYRIHLTTHSKPNPQVAPNFCMVLRKNLIGLRIKNIITSNLERVVTIEFEGFDDVDDIISKKLIIELMGKHCNIVLLDDSGIIIDSLRHIVSSDLSTRSIIPHSKYIYPMNNKDNFLDICNSKDFEDKLHSLNHSTLNIENLPACISNGFNGISKTFIISAINNLKLKDISSLSLNKLYDYITQIIYNTDNLNLGFEKLKIPNKKTEDYSLIMKENDSNFSLSFFIDDFYYEKEALQEFKAYKENSLKLVLNTKQKYKKRLINMDKKLEECKNMDIYRLYGELITANLYRIKDFNIDEIKLENYYDNNNFITITLDKKYPPSINAKMFFKKYSKLKNALQIVSEQKAETLDELNYIDSIIYELDNCKTLDDISTVLEEISENETFRDINKKLAKKSNNKSKKGNKNKNNSTKFNFNPIKYDVLEEISENETFRDINKKLAKKSNNKSKKGNKNKNNSTKFNFNPIKYDIGNYTLLVGRNNVENDYLTLKYAKKTDIWFHTKDIHGSHCVLVLNGNNIPSNDILIRCAEIAAYHSKGKNSSNVPVDYCEVKFVKKPNKAKPGMVIYTHNKTLNVEPKISN